MQTKKRMLMRVAGENVVGLISNKKLESAWIFRRWESVFAKSTS